MNSQVIQSVNDAISRLLPKVPWEDAQSDLLHIRRVVNQLHADYIKEQNKNQWLEEMNQNQAREAWEQRNP